MYVWWSGFLGEAFVHGVYCYGQAELNLHIVSPKEYGMHYGWYVSVV